MKRFYIIPLILCFFLVAPSCNKSQEAPRTKVEKKMEKKVDKKNKNKAQGTMELDSKDATLKIVAGSGNVLGIDLTNNVPVGGVQFTIEGVQLNEVRATSRITGFLVDFNRESGIVIIISASGGKIVPGTGLIAEIISDKGGSANVSGIKIAN